MKQIDFHGQVIEANAAATRAAFANIPQGGPEMCGCEPCLMFARTRATTYPTEFRVLLEELGIPYDREEEVWDTGQLENGLYFFAGWFHFVGELVGGSDVSVETSSQGRNLELHPLTDSFSAGVTRRVSMVKATFDKQAVLQLEFQTEIPWVEEE